MCIQCVRLLVCIFERARTYARVRARFICVCINMYFVLACSLFVVHLPFCSFLCVVVSFLSFTPSVWVCDGHIHSHMHTPYHAKCSSACVCAVVYVNRSTPRACIHRCVYVCIETVNLQHSYSAAFRMVFVFLRFCFHSVELKPLTRLDVYFRFVTCVHITTQPNTSFIFLA